MAGLLAAAGCSTQPVSGPTKTVVVTRTAVPSDTPTPTGSPAGSASATSTPAVMHRLPGRCGDLLPPAAIDNALGHAVGGGTSFVVGKPEKDIGRIGYLNCRYGVPSGAAASAAPKVEIGVSLYRTAALAAARIPATVDDYAAHGASSTTTKVDGLSAKILTGGRGGGYTAPTLVAVDGQRTVAVTVNETAGSSATKDLIALAKLALTNTAQ